MKSIVKRIAGKPLARPLSSILNQARPYTNAANTNLAETFARLRGQSAIVLPAGVTAIKRTG